MSQSTNSGCLAALFGAKGSSVPQSGSLPYRLRDDFLSPAEMAFYRALRTAVGDRLVICTKVNLADVFFVARPNENQSYLNRIDRKHLDFLLCDPMTMRPLLGIELDDSSHRRADRQERDRFVDDVFRTAHLPLGHVRVQAAYDPADLYQWLSQLLGGGRQVAAAAEPAPPEPVPAVGPPLCPKCGVPMVLRVAARGPNEGERFYGCPNYPRCREVVPYRPAEGRA